MAERRGTKCVAYYWRLLWRAVQPSFHVSDAISGIVGAVLPPLAKLFGAEEKMSPLTWEVPICAFAVLMIVRIIAAPFLLHRETEMKAARLLRRAAKKRVAAHAEALALRERLDERSQKRSAKDMLANLLKIGESLLHQIPNAADEPSQLAWRLRFEDWRDSCHSQIQSTIGEAEAVSVYTHRGTLLMFTDNPPASDTINHISWKMEALRDLIAKY